MKPIPLQQYRNQLIDITYDPALKAVRIAWDGFASHQPYCQAWNKVLRIALENECNRWLINQKKLQGTSPLAIQWLLREGYPCWADALSRLKAKQKSVMVTVLTDALFAELARKTTLHKNHHLETTFYGAAGPETDFYYFRTEPEAVAYLAQGLPVTTPG